MGSPKCSHLHIWQLALLLLICSFTNASGTFDDGGVNRKNFDHHSRRVLTRLERTVSDFASTTLPSAETRHTELVSPDCKPEHQILMSVFDTLTGKQRRRLFRKLRRRKTFACIRSTSGRTKYFGVPDVTMSREESAKIITMAKKEPGMKVANDTDNISAAARKTAAVTEEDISDEQKTCELVSLENLVQINRPYLDLLLNMGAQREHDILEEHMQRVFQNKLSGYTSTGRDQLASSEGACWEQAYVPIYIEYCLSVMRKLGLAEEMGMVGVVNRMGLKKQHEAHVARLTASKRSLKQWRELTLEAMSRLSPSDSLSGWTERQVGSCHPVCAMLLASSRTFGFYSVQTCCSQCFGEFCEDTAKEESVLSSSEVWSLVKVGTETVPEVEVQVFRLYL